MLLNLKGFAIGTGIFVVLTFLYLYFTLRSSGARATGLNVITSLTVQNWVYWVAFLVIVGASSAIVGWKR